MAVMRKGSVQHILLAMTRQVLGHLIQKGAVNGVPV